MMWENPAKTARRSQRRRRARSTKAIHAMHYVYLIESVREPHEIYLGRTEDLRARLADHNAGRSVHTAKFRLWNLVQYHAFAEQRQAVEFERYLKSGSGRAFRKRHFGR
jgi:putative endonuclease